MCDDLKCNANDLDAVKGEDVIIKDNLIWKIKRMAGMYMREVNYNTDDYIYNLDKTRGMTYLVDEIIKTIRNLKIDTTRGESK